MLLLATKLFENDVSYAAQLKAVLNENILSDVLDSTLQTSRYRQRAVVLSSVYTHLSLFYNPNVFTNL